MQVSLLDILNATLLRHQWYLLQYRSLIHPNGSRAVSVCPILWSSPKVSFLGFLFVFRSKRVSKCVFLHGRGDRIRDSDGLYLFPMALE